MANSMRGNDSHPAIDVFGASLSRLSSPLARVAEPVSDRGALPFPRQRCFAPHQRPGTGRGWGFYGMVMSASLGDRSTMPSSPSPSAAPAASHAAAVVAIDMGYGHMRPARALARYLGTEVLHADLPPLAD